MQLCRFLQDLCKMIASPKKIENIFAIFFNGYDVAIFLGVATNQLEKSSISYEDGEAKPWREGSIQVSQQQVSPSILYSIIFFLPKNNNNNQLFHASSS